jgi:hypothetical protein
VSVFFLIGGLFLLIDVYVVMTQATRQPDAVVVGGGTITVAGVLGGVIILLGFAFYLFGMIEARLIDIELAIKTMRETTPPPSQPSAAPSPTPPPSTAA